MPPVDWSWGQSYPSPTFVVPESQPLSSMEDASNAFDSAMPSGFADSKPPQDLASDFQPHNMQSPATQHPSSKPKTSRKRSRDEMTEGLDDQDSDDSRSSVPPFPSARPTPSPPKQSAASQAEPILGPGMTLIYPDDDASMARAQMDPASQTGTWAEELAERLRSSSMRETNQRPPIESRKSLRLDRDAAAKMDDVASAVIAADPRVKITEDSGPTIDEASYTLGVAWSCIPSNPTMDAATRGWARHIEARFPLRSVRFVWMNKSLPAYLICAVTYDGRESSGSPTRHPSIDSQPWAWSDRIGNPAYYLFDESLSQGRLIAKSWERTVENLRASPLAFEGEQVLQSAESADQAQQINPVPSIATLHDLPDDGMMTDLVADQPMDSNSVPVYEPQYWAGWGKPYVYPLYPGHSPKSCSHFENHSRHQHMAAMIEAGGAQANMVGGDGMDLDY